MRSLKNIPVGGKQTFGHDPTSFDTLDAGNVRSEGLV